MKKKILSFIGCGNMGEAILKGVTDSSYLNRSEVGLFEKDPGRRDHISETYGITAAGSLCHTVSGSRYLLVAVKPQDIRELAVRLKECPGIERTAVISIIAGISTLYYEDMLDMKLPVIRVMPNTPALYKKGMITISRGRFAGREHIEFVTGLMGSIGQCMEIEESLQHVSTSINGSGPAYFFLFCKALVEAANSWGMDSTRARKLVTRTMLGAAEMLERSELDMDELIARVASPGGTTEKALETFNKQGLQTMVADAVSNAVRRSKELEGEMGR